MKKYNDLIIYNKNEDKILFCVRAKEPYKGKLNFIGGKVEKDEDIYDAAYRELEEETGITRNDTKLEHIMNIQYILEDKELEFFVGKLKHDVTLIEEKNKLCWIDIDSEFYDTDAFAGDGNIWHIVKYAELNKKFEKNIF